MNQESPVSGRQYSAVHQLVLARLREFFRVPEAIFWVYGFPLLIAVALGIAFRNRPVEKVVVDVQQSAGQTEKQIQDVVQKLSQDSRIQTRTVSPTEAQKRLQTGKTDLVVAIDQNGNGYQYLYEPNRTESTLARSIVDGALVRAEAGSAAPAVTDQHIETKGARYVDFLMPGLIGMNLMGGGLWGIGFVIVDLRSRKLLKRYLATPMRKSDFLSSLAISRLVFTIPEVLLLLVFGYYAFGVGIQGSLLLLIGVFVLGAVCFSSIGLLVASRAARIETVSGLMNLVMLPMFVLSGVFFSAERFPEIAQPFVQALPLTALNDAIRAIMLEGNGITSSLTTELLILTAWSVVCFFLALKWFKWQ